MLPHLHIHAAPNICFVAGLIGNLSLSIQSPVTVNKRSLMHCHWPRNEDDKTVLWYRETEIQSKELLANFTLTRSFSKSHLSSEKAQQHSYRFFDYHRLSLNELLLNDTGNYWCMLVIHSTSYTSPSVPLEVKGQQDIHVHLVFK